MRLAFSSTAFTNASLEEAIHAVAAVGYEGIEILCGEPHAVPDGLGSEEILAVAQALRGAGLAVSNLHAFSAAGTRDTYHPSWIDPAETEWRTRYTRRCLELAGAWGVPHLSTFSGGLLQEGQDRAGAVEHFRRGLESLYPDCRRTGARIPIEPGTGLLIETSEQFLEFADTVDPECVGLDFDIDHFSSVGEDPAVLVPRLARWTWHYHLRGILADRLNDQAAQGQTPQDLAGVLWTVSESGYGGFMTVEADPRTHDSAASARAWMKHLRSCDVAL